MQLKLLTVFLNIYLCLDFFFLYFLINLKVCSIKVFLNIHVDIGMMLYITKIICCC